MRNLLDLPERAMSDAMSQLRSSFYDRALARYEAIAEMRIELMAARLLQSDWSPDTLLRTIDGLQAISERYLGMFGARVLDYDKPGVAVDLYSSGLGIGEQTLTSATTTASLFNASDVTIAVGELTAFSAAEGGPEITYADTMVGAAGFDYVIVDHTRYEYENATSVSSKFMFIDFGWTNFSGPTLITRETTVQVAGRLDIPEGNVSALEFDVAVSGRNTALSVDAITLAIEGLFSEASLLTLGATSPTSAGAEHDLRGVAANHRINDFVVGDDGALPGENEPDPSVVVFDFNGGTYRLSDTSQFLSFIKSIESDWNRQSQAWYSEDDLLLQLATDGRRGPITESILFEDIVASGELTMEQLARAGADYVDTVDFFAFV